MSTWAITSLKTDYNVSAQLLLPAVEEVIAKRCSILDCAPPIREAKATICLHRRLAFEDILNNAAWDRNRFDPREKTREVRQKSLRGVISLCGKEAMHFYRKDILVFAKNHKGQIRTLVFKNKCLL